MHYFITIATIIFSVWLYWKLVCALARAIKRLTSDGDAQ